MRNIWVLYFVIFTVNLLNVASIQLTEKCIYGMVNCISCTRFDLPSCHAGTKFEVQQEDYGYGSENVGICTPCLPNTYQLNDYSCVSECFFNRTNGGNSTDIMRTSNNANPSFSKNNNIFVIFASLAITYYYLE